jgi:serine/threonine-protein kinase
MITLRLFGGAALARDGQRLTGPATQRHRLALLALLASHRPRAAPREKLIGYLWPDALRGRQLLKQSVYELRRALGEGVIVSSGNDLWLASDAIDFDVMAFEEAVAAGDPEHAVGLYTGPFLDGFSLPDAPEFEHWVDRERERLRLVCCGALEQLAEAAQTGGDAARAAEWWRRRLAQDPHNALVTLRLMEALTESGDRAAAIQHARVHTLLLKRDFDAQPDPAVEALADRLRTEPQDARLVGLPGIGVRAADESRVGRDQRGAPLQPAAPLRARRASRWWRGTRTVATSVLVLLIGVAAAVSFSERGAPYRAIRIFLRRA